MFRQQLVTAMCEQSVNPISCLQAALTRKVKYRVAHFLVSVTLISRSIVGLLLCDMEAGELDIGLVW